MIIDDNPFPFDLPQDRYQPLVERRQVRLFVECRCNDRYQDPPPTTRLTSPITLS
jgi:hypothetical protein